MNDQTTLLRPENEQENIYMSLDGIVGEVTQAGFEDQIAVRRFEYRVDLPLVAERTRGGATRDKSIHSTVSITKVADLSSVKIFQHCCEGIAIGDITISFVRFSQASLMTARKIVLTDCFVGSFEHLGDSNLTSDLALERINFDFATITDTYTQQLGDGSVGGNVEFGWDRLNGVSA